MGDEFLERMEAHFTAVKDEDQAIFGTKQML